jgi:hypothetical protein
MLPRNALPCACAGDTASADCSPESRSCRPIAVHIGNDWAAQGREADPPKSCRQCVGVSRAFRFERHPPNLRPRPPLSCNGLRDSAGRRLRCWRQSGADLSLSSFSGARSLAPVEVRRAPLRSQPLGHRCNSIHPTFIRTPILDSLIAGRDETTVLEKLARQVPLGRLGEAGDVASAIVYLASDESRFMTGSGIKLDGGISAM